MLDMLRFYIHVVSVTVAVSRPIFTLHIAGCALRTPYVSPLHFTRLLRFTKFVVCSDNSIRHQFHTYRIKLHLASLLPRARRGGGEGDCIRHSDRDTANRGCDSRCPRVREDPRCSRTRGRGQNPRCLNGGGCTLPESVSYSTL